MSRSVDEARLEPLYPEGIGTAESTITHAGLRRKVMNIAGRTPAQTKAQVKGMRSLAGLALAAGLLGGAAMTATAQSSPAPTAQSIAATTPPAGLDAIPTSQSFQEGIYLFGEVPVRDQIGAAYFVLDVQDEAVVGGVYMPHSSFDCFQGELTGDRLNLEITNSYDLTTHAYSVALQTDGTMASAHANTVPVGLEGLHPIASVSDADLQILETCKADFQ
jgi:hypothetical protein